MRSDIIPYEPYHLHLGYTLSIACLGWFLVSLYCAYRPSIPPRARVAMYALVIVLPVYAEVASYLISLIRPAPDTAVGYQLTHLNANLLDHLPLDTKLSPGARLVFIVCLLGLAFLSIVRFGAGTLRLRRRMAGARPLNATSYSYLAAPLNDIAVASGGTLPPILVSDASVPIAFTAEILRPTIYVTTALLALLESDEVVAVICHEWAHVRRRDILWNSVIGVLRDMVWFFPGGHLAWRSMAASQDEACDLLAARMTGQPLALARALIKVANPARSTGVLPPATGFFGRGRSLSARIEQMLRLNGQGGPFRAPAGIALGAYLLASALLIVSILPALLGS